MAAKAHTVTTATVVTKTVTNVENVTLTEQADMQTKTTSGDKHASVAWVENCRAVGQIQSSDVSIMVGGPRSGDAGSIIIKMPLRAQGSGFVTGNTCLIGTALNSVVGNVGVGAPGSGPGSMLTIDFTAVSANGSDAAVTWTLGAAA